MKPAHLALCLFAVGLGTASAPVFADKPAWAGKNGQTERSEYSGADKHAGKAKHADKVAFDDSARRIIGDYYGAMSKKGKCPPGLAKKNNGCLPPGQAKKWAAGKPLPSDLKYSRLPADLLKRLPPPPAQHEYVRIAGDVLLIAMGTRMVIDAVEDILR